MESTPKLKILLEGNDYVVFSFYEGYENTTYDEKEELKRFDRSEVGDQIARKMAEIYKDAFKEGFSNGYGMGCDPCS